MAKLETIAAIENWDQANETLRRLGQIARETNRLENALNKRVEQAKADYQEKADPLVKEKKALERDLEKFCVRNRSDFDGAQSRMLGFGFVRFRAKSKLVIHNVQNTLAAIKGLLNKAAERYIRTTETPDKEAMETLPDEMLAKIGVVRKRGEEWGYEIDWEKLGE